MSIRRLPPVLSFQFKVSSSFCVHEVGHLTRSSRSASNRTWPTKVPSARSRHPCASPPPSTCRPTRPARCDRMRVMGPRGNFICLVSVCCSSATSYSLIIFYFLAMQDHWLTRCHQTPGPTGNLRLRPIRCHQPRGADEQRALYKLCEIWAGGEALLLGRGELSF